MDAKVRFCIETYASAESEFGIYFVPSSTVTTSLVLMSRTDFEVYVCMYIEMFIQGYPRHSSGNYGIPVVKKLVKIK